MENFDIRQKSLEIQDIISIYTKESFVCFFADFIRHNPERNHFGFSHKLKSKLKDSLYLIMLRLSSPIIGEEVLIFSEEVDKNLQKVADILLQIVGFYLGDIYSKDFDEIKNERHKTIVHEMAFKDYFQNGVLNYREQELNKVIRLFHPYQDKIKERLGIEFKSLIDIFQYSEEDYRKKSIKYKSFAFKNEFAKFARKSFNGEIPNNEFSNEFSHLSEHIQNDFLDFYERPHSCLLFTKADYYDMFDENDVDIFCELFSLPMDGVYDILFYSQPNPLGSKPIIKINDTEYLNVYQKQLPTALYSLLYTTLTASGKETEQVNLRRGKVILENHTREIFERFFKKSKHLQIFNNYYVNENTEEKDLLIIADRNAFIIECKSSRNREPRRDITQAFQRIKSDFNHCIQKGYEQCYQVEQLILNCPNISIKSNNLVQDLDTSYIRDVFSVIVTSERFATVQSDLGLLLNKPIAEDLYPWSISIDDLEIFLKTLDLEFNNPTRRFAEFLEYRELLNEKLFSRDELDVCAMYLKNPSNFKKICESSDYVVTDPLLQQHFDGLYFAKKLKFNVLDF
ncbi:NERD domain-containing protein [Gillisia limnaea]|uniref:NERD domain-containing protein n=1 Tax=Gillisia limnaea (strain DSM 15749 / LMG 21470 / R-8282) TaxID=865937 RepID=H2BXV4_GILLR|nr:NERD domain-containing protein [Gillisia limnaea]EHQ02117.1 hypothetical protein Gilli_1462 [Gillisia limnaea DSM 15749]